MLKYWLEMHAARRSINVKLPAADASESRLQLVVNANISY